MFYYFNSFNKDLNWSYAYPEQIYEQIKMHTIDDIEVQYLFEILREMILPLNSEEPDWQNSDIYSKYEIRQFSQKSFLEYSTKTIITKLLQVENKLRNDLRYECYHYILPHIDTTNIKKKCLDVDVILNLDSIDNIYDNNQL